MDFEKIFWEDEVSCDVQVKYKSDSDIKIEIVLCLPYRTFIVFCVLASTSLASVIPVKQECNLKRSFERDYEILTTQIVLSLLKSVRS